MDSGTILVTIILLSIAVLPFVLSGNSREKKKKSLFRKLLEMAEKNNCKITQHEFCGNFVVGLDGMTDHFFFCKKVENLEICEKINLREFQSCKVINTNRTLNNKKEHFYVIDKLELCFYPVRKNLPETRIEIYNNDYDDLTLSGELQLAEKWVKLLNEILKKSQVIKKISHSFTAEPIKNPKKEKSAIILKA
jgi:hypothetical protein